MVSKVYVVGIGMGNPGTLTVAARDAIEGSGLLVGAARMLESFAHMDAEKAAAIAPGKIVEALAASDAPVASVLMSGDVGFYSGATGLYPLLDELGVEVEAIPGISSVVYFCAKLHTTWQDAHLVSAHGRAHNAIGAIQSHAKTFLLTGGDTKVADVCRTLVDRGLGDVVVHVGERLSYDDERVTTGTANELHGRDFDELAVMLVENPAPLVRAFEAPSLADDAFERGSVPMTKEEVRELAVCKLRVAADHVVWDVGAGTGSVSVEATLAAREGLVCAIEKDEEALALLQVNKERFGLPNMQIVAGAAPEALAGLPAPDRVFVGGSSGQLEAILRMAMDANPQVRFCISAITLETMAEALRCIKDLGLSRVDIASMSFAKSRDVGPYHMMMGANPIYLVSCEGPNAEGDESRSRSHGGGESQ